MTVVATLSRRSEVAQQQEMAQEYLDTFGIRDEDTGLDGLDLEGFKHLWSGLAGNRLWLTTTQDPDPELDDVSETGSDSDHDVDEELAVVSRLIHEADDDEDGDADSDDDHDGGNTVYDATVEDEGARTVDDETAEDAGSTGVASESEPNADENEVEMIVGKKVDTNEVLYKVWWAGCDAIDDTWEPEQGLTHAADAVACFNQKPAATRSTHDTAGHRSESGVSQTAASLRA